MKLMRSVLLLFCAMFLTAMETQAIDGNLITPLVCELEASEDIDLLNFAAFMGKYHIELTNERLKNVEILAAKTHYQTEDVDQLDAMLRLNEQTKIKLLEARNQQREIYLRRRFKDVAAAIFAEVVAWQSIVNSIERARRETLPLTVIIREALRAYTTSGNNVLTNGEFWRQNHVAAQDVLAFLMSKRACMPIVDSRDALVMFVENAEPKYWYLARLLTYLNKVLDLEEDSPLKINDEDLEILKASDTPSQNLESVKEQLQATQLFKILDAETRVNAGVLKQLADYDFYFPGTIEDYAYQQSLQAERALLSMAKEPQKKQKNHRNNKKKTRGKKKHKEKETEKRRRETRSSEKPSHRATTPIGASSASRSDIVVVDTGGVWTVVDNSRHTSQKVSREAEHVTPPYEDLIRFSHDDQKLHFFDYNRYLSIWDSDTTDYRFHGKSYVTKSIFQDLEKEFPKLKNSDGSGANSLAYFVTYHGIDEQNKRHTHTFYGNHLYTSSFSGSDSLAVAESLLDSVELNQFAHKDLLKDLYLKSCLAKKCSSHVVDGFWAYNAHHSEALFSVDFFKNRIRKHVRAMAKQHQKFKIEGVVIGIASRYDLCFRCQRLLQGVQWSLIRNLHDSMKNLRDKAMQIEIDPELSSLALVRSRVRVKNSDPRNTNEQAIGKSKLNNKQPPELGGADYARYGRHQLIRHRI